MRKLLYITAHWAAGSLLLFVSLLYSPFLSGQEVWPGDINNNGIVNGVDLLYHGVAEGMSGPKRDEPGVQWVAYDSAPQWSDQFSDGINYSSADVNGKGKVEARDRRALWQGNYGNTHGGVIPDIYLQGDPNTDSSIEITAATNQVSAGGLAEFSISLGDANQPITDFFGITFTLKFDPTYVADETIKPLWDPESVDLELLSNTWLNNQTDKAEAFVHLDNALGELEVVIMRTESGSTSGHGEIASVMVAIEDIVMLEDTPTAFTVEDIKLIDDQLVESPIAGSSTTVVIEANTMALQVDESDGTTAGVGVGLVDDTASEEPETITADQWTAGETEEKGVVELRVYPNPVVNQLQVETGSTVELVENMRLFAADGQLLLQQNNVQASSASMDVSRLPQGNYFLQLETSTGVTVKQINK